eukprot:gene2331-2553_t
MAKIVRVAAIQMACSTSSQENIAKAEAMVRQAAQQGAQIILLQELFEQHYFCQEQASQYFDWAHEDVPQDSFLQHFASLAKQLSVVLPISFFERDNNVYYNSVVVFDADGSKLGKYRKSHIPDGPGYQEKFYFTPGDTGFKVFQTQYARIGLGICWDQWFPETARSLVLQGAELLFYPTAIGSEPENPGYDSSAHWQRTMIGHACANMTPVIASNRIGCERFSRSEITFYGSSFICNETGEKVAEATRDQETVLVASFDLTKVASNRAAWGLFRDRRPDLYHPIITKNGHTIQPK